MCRTNESKGRLTGALTGLGPARTSEVLSDKLSLVENTEAFFPHHNVETRFDVTINNKDLDLVNEICYWMNVCISKTELNQLTQLTHTSSLDKERR